MSYSSLLKLWLWYACQVSEAMLRTSAGLIRICVPLVAAMLASCAPAPIKPSPQHIAASDATPDRGTIPPLVQAVPALPKPKPSVRPEVYSVVVQNVRAQDLLFALARDARLQIDIHPSVEGSVTLNAIDQTLPQLLERVSRQIDMRYELNGDTLLVMRDTPFLRTYRIDYVSATRNVKMLSTSSTQFSSGGASGGASSGATGSTSTVDVVSTNQLWDSLVQNVREILQETDKILPGATTTPGAAAPAAAAPAAPPPPAPAGAAPPAPPAPGAATTSGFREAASVIGNREGGVLFVRATSRQHERVREFLDQVMSNVRRQVLIEATIAEVQLNNSYQRGIDWSRIRRGTSGISLQGFAAPALPSTVVDTGAFIISAANASRGFLATMRLLETFGDIKILSSPKLSVLNNQIALLRVTRDIVYFTITPSTTPVTIAGGSGNITVQNSFTTSPNVAAEGFLMTVLPQVSDTDTIVLNVRPTIRRRIGFATDPNPALSAANPNLIPVFETRELDSILRIQNGEIAVLGGLMQDQANRNEDTIPGVRDIPGLGELLTQRRNQTTKTELVIFLRASIIRDSSIDGDYRPLRSMLPDEDFLNRPNPGRPAPPAGEERQ